MALNTHVSMDNPAWRFAVYLTAGIAYAVGGYLSKVRNNPSIEFDRRKAGKTVLIGAVAGGVAASWGDGFDDATLAAAMGVAVPIVDQAWSSLAPPEWGGSEPGGESV